MIDILKEKLDLETAVSETDISETTVSIPTGIRYFTIFPPCSFLMTLTIAGNAQ